MQRIGRWTRLKPDAIEEYRRWHRQPWPEITDITRQAGIRNYSIYIRGNELFSYLEVDDWQTAVRGLAAQPLSDEWQKLMAPFMDADEPEAPWMMLEEVFHLD